MVGFRWLDQKKSSIISIDDFPGYRDNPHTDKWLAKPAYDLLDEADIVIAHNGDRFDIKHLNTLFLKHIGYPPGPYKTVDTCKQSRSNFYQNSHKLDDQSQRYLGNHKAETGGFKLWRDIDQDQCPKAFRMMKKYCRHDVDLLYDWYMKIRPFIKTHASVAMFEDASEVLCDTCGGTNYKFDGKMYSRHCIRQRYFCKDCKKRFSAGPNLRSKEGRANATRNAA